MNSSVSRREFLHQVGLAGAAWAVLPRWSRAVPLNEKLNVACIGVNGMGWSDLHSVAASPHANIAALCDVDANHLAKAAQEFTAARKYSDWRELLEKEGKNIDAVTVTVPDHMHAAIAMSALRLGKHVFCQKPLTHDLWETRQLTLAARQAGVATQMGIQLSAGQGERMAVQMIQDGAIGKIKQVYLWSCKPTDGMRPLGPRPPREDPVPENLKWDLWLGTAPARPFVKGTYHPGVWRGWQDFGSGWLGDMGCHIYSGSFRALKLTAPRSVRAQVEPEWASSAARRTETWPVWQIVTYTFPGTELTAGKTIDVTWSDGGKYPPDSLLKRIEADHFQEQATLLVGEEGVMLVPHGGGPQLFPAEKFQGYKRPEIPPIDHYLAWVDACRGEGKTIANFDYAGPLTEMVLLGTVALRCPEQTLEWDAKELKVTNVAEANKYIKREYRKGWAVDGLG